MTRISSLLLSLTLIVGCNKPSSTPTTLSTTLPAPTGATETDVRRIEGTWFAYKSERAGALQESGMTVLTMTIEGDRLYMNDEGPTPFMQIVAIDWQKKPAELRLRHPDDGDKSDQVIICLIEATTDTLSLCFPGERAAIPTSFDTKGTKHQTINATRTRRKRDELLAARIPSATDVQATGRVTYKGKPLSDAKISFHPEVGAKPVHSLTDPGGAYSLAVPIGHYHVTVEVESEPSSIPSLYSALDTTPFRFKVSAQGNRFDLELVTDH